VYCSPPASKYAARPIFASGAPVPGRRTQTWYSVGNAAGLAASAAAVTSCQVTYAAAPISNGGASRFGASGSGSGNSGMPSLARRPKSSRRKPCSNCDAAWWTRAAPHSQVT